MSSVSVFYDGSDIDVAGFVRKITLTVQARSCPSPILLASLSPVPLYSLLFTSLARTLLHGNKCDKLVRSPNEATKSSHFP